MTLNDLAIILLVVATAYALWQHNNTSLIARAAVKRHCKKAGVQLLDENVIFKCMTVRRSAHSLFALQRQYKFEFSSIGDARYSGNIILIGPRVSSIELAPFKTPVAPTDIHDA